MEGKKLTALIIWGGVALMVCVIILVALLIFQQIAPSLLAITDTATVETTLQTTEHVSMITELEKGQKKESVNDIYVEYLGCTFEQSISITGERGEIGGVGYGYKVIKLKIKLYNNSTQPKKYFHFARCFVNNERMYSVRYKFHPSGNPEDPIAIVHDMTMTDIYFEGEIDGGRAESIEMLFRVSQWVTRVDFDYYYDATEESYEEKKAEGYYPDRFIIKYGKK